MAEEPFPFRWLLFGIAGLLLVMAVSVAVALFGLRGSGPPSQAIEQPAPRANGLTFVREIGGGSPRTPTPPPAGPQAVAAVVRPPRQAGLVTITEQGTRRMLLAGAVPFSDEAPRNLAWAADDGAGGGGAGVQTTAAGAARLAPVSQLTSWTRAPLLPMLALAPRGVPFGDLFAILSSPTGSNLPSVAAAPLEAADSSPTINVDLSDSRLSPGQSLTIRLEASDDRGVSSIWWWAEDTGDDALKETRSYTCGGVSPCRRSWTVSTSQTGRVVVKARARDTADHVAETQQVFRVVAEPTATPTAPAPTTVPAPAIVPATPTIAPTPTVQDLTVRVPALGARGAATPTTPPSPAVAAPTARSAEPAPILAERTRPVLQPPAPRAASAQPQDGVPPAVAPTAVPLKEPSTAEQFAARALAAANGARAQAGALPLLRHAALDTAAGAHAQYASASNDANLNGETPGSDFFTGETPAIRVTRANTGRPPALSRVGEVMSLGEPEPERIVAGWLASVYHRAVLLDLAAQFGGFGRGSDDASASAVLDLAGRRDLSSAVGRYPGDGQSGVPIGCVCDDYAVASDRTGPFGYPVTLLLGGATPGGQLSARLYENSGADVEVPVDLVDAFGQPTIVPRAPLKPNTRYTARFQWSGGPDVRWSFTTAQ